MRVLMISPCYYPVKGGAETMVRTLSILLNKNGVHTDVMTFNMDHKWSPKWRGNVEIIDGITVFRIPGLNWLPIEHSPRITMEINLIPGRFTNLLKLYDIIHFHETDFSFPLFSFLVEKPKILHLHAIRVHFWERYHLSRLILKHVVDSYISISKQMTKDLISLSIPREKIAYLPNGVDVKLFSPKEKKEDNLLLFVGRITDVKGLHVLLESLSYIRDSVHLVIIGPFGSDPKYSQNIFNGIVKKMNEEGKHTVSYLGALDQADIVEWYQKASIFVLPSRGPEAFPVALLEALSCGTPVVATNVGGVPEIVQDSENGLLVPPNNTVELSEKIQYLLDNKRERTRMGREGRKLAVRNFSLDERINKLCNIYKQLSND